MVKSGYEISRGDRVNSDSDILTMCMYGIIILLIFGCVTSGADTPNPKFSEVQNSGVALTPCHIGEDYSFTGNYENGQVTITGPGDYYLSENLTTASTDYAIQIKSPDVILEGNGKSITGAGDSGSGINITSDASGAEITNFSSISGFYEGILSNGEFLTISKNMIHDNKARGIYSIGNYSDIEENYVFNNSDVGIYSFGHFSLITKNYASGNRNGILSQGNFANISENAGNENSNYGIFAGGMHVGPEPGIEGHGYYARVINNVAILNSAGGIKSVLPHAIIQDNSVFQNTGNGIEITWRSNNTTISGNYISDNPVGIRVSDRVLNISIIQNLIRSDGNSVIYIESDNGNGNGVIFDNILSSPIRINGSGNIGAFLWTNPTGPTPGTNIRDGPFIAGNYWTNSNHTGWSDQQPGNPDGYTTIPYEVTSGVYDTAPLVNWTGTPTPTPVPLVANFTADPITGVPPLSVQFTDLSPGSPTKWRWNFGDGSYSALQNPLHIYGGIGRYTVTLEVESRDLTAIVRKTEFVKTHRPKK